MANESGERPGQVNETEQAREEIRKEIAEARAERSKDLREYNEEKLRQRLERELKQTKTAAREVVTKGFGKTRQEAADVRRSVARILEAVKEGLLTPPEKTKELLTNLADKGLTDQTAAHLHGFLQKYLNKDISLSQPGQPKTEFEKDFEVLKGSDPLSAELVGDSIIESAEGFGITGEIAREKFRVEDQVDQEREMREALKWGRRGEEFAGLGIDSLHEFFDKEDEEILSALQSVDKFAEVTEKLKNKLNEERREQGKELLEGDELGRELSKRIEQEIVVKFSKLTRKVDSEKPNEVFEDIVQEGTFYNSIQIIRTQLLRKVELLTIEAERRSGLGTDNQSDLPEILQSIQFFKRFSEKDLGKREVDIGGGEIKTISTERIMPVPKNEPTSLGDFFRSLHTQIDNEYVARGYMHNVRSIFLRGKGERGFWDQLKSYATRLGSSDIDRLTLLPDNELFMSAYQLYTKYVEERFALHDWIHQPNMFINDLEGTTSKIEDKVLEDLKKLFPDAAKDPWRLRRALNLGVGLSKGVFLTEIESAAWADPNVRTDKEGESTFVSYYTNDNAALQTLNPLHYFLRWQQEGLLKGPTLFMPVEGYSRSMFGLWDHAKLWERMNAFRESWTKGQAAYDKFKNQNEKTFFEILPNIGHVGSFITRSGWRMAGGAYEGWMEYLTEQNGKPLLEGSVLDVENSWKAIENIGYEALLNFSVNRIDKDFLKNDSPERNSFFKYLNEKYINFDNGTGGVKRSLEDEIKKTKDQLTEEWKKDPHKRKIEVSDKDIYERLLYKALTGVLRNRIPTKFIRIERDRTSEKGIRAWDQIRKDLNLTPSQMDETMDDLMMVELRLRQETSAGMTKYLEGGSETLRGYDGANYVVTKANIERILGEIGLEQENIERATKLFDKIDSSYLQNDQFINKFSKKIQEKEFPFAIATEELETKFLAFRASGESILSRAMGDTASMEQRVSDKLQGYLDSLHEASISPQHDISKVLETLLDVKKVYEEIHGPQAGFEIAHHLVGFTIAYFKKDTAAKNWIGRLTRVGRYNSIASEVAGTFRGVWEWENSDIDNFIVELERRRIVPKGEHELRKGPEIERREPLNLFGLKIPMGYKKIQYASTNEITGKRLRKDFGATKLNIATEFLSKYLPLILLFILFQAIARAAKEELGGGDRK